MFSLILTLANYCSKIWVRCIHLSSHTLPVPTVKHVYKLNSSELILRLCFHRYFILLPTCPHFPLSHSLPLPTTASTKSEERKKSPTTTQHIKQQSNLTGPDGIHEKLKYKHASITVIFSPHKLSTNMFTETRSYILHPN